MSEAGTQKVVDDGEPVAAGRSFAERFVGAFRLDGSVYEEVATDPGALAHAAGVVACVAAARAIGLASLTTPMQAGIEAVAAFGFWLILAALVWSVGRLLRHPGDFGRVLRAVGFAMSPLILVVLILIPNEWIRVGVMLVTYALLFGAIVVAVRPALRIDTGSAAFVCILVALILFFIYSVALYAALQMGGTS
jgi:Yip1 domain